MFGIDDAIAAVANVGKTAIDKIWPDANEVERAKAERLLTEMSNEYQLRLAQIQTNQEEARSGSLFISGWRPAVGWTCALGFSYEFLVRPLFTGISYALGFPVVFPGIEVEALSSLLMGLLGLGTLRTVEKIKKVARS